MARCAAACFSSSSARCCFLASSAARFSCSAFSPACQRSVPHSSTLELRGADGAFTVGERVCHTHGPGRRRAHSAASTFCSSSTFLLCARKSGWLSSRARPQAPVRRASLRAEAAAFVFPLGKGIKVWQGGARQRVSLPSRWSWRMASACCWARADPTARCARSGASALATRHRRSSPCTRAEACWCARGDLLTTARGGVAGTPPDRTPNPTPAFAGQAERACLPGMGPGR